MFMVFPILRFSTIDSSDATIYSSVFLMIPSLILTLLQQLAIGIAYLYLVLALKRIRYLESLAHGAYAGYIIFNFLIDFIDYENRKETSSTINQYYFSAYMFPTTYFQQKFAVNGSALKSIITLTFNLEMIGSTVSESPWSFILITLTTFLTFGIAGLSVVLNCRLQKIKNKRKVNGIAMAQEQQPLIQQALIINQEPKLSAKKNIIVNSTYLFLVAVFVISFICFLNSEDTTFEEVAPSMWVFFKSSRKTKMPDKEYMEAVSLFRNMTSLPDDEDWIDQCPVPLYPLVHGKKNFACSYNNLENCSINMLNIEEQRQPPNVVLIIVESFSPSPSLLDNKIVNSQNVIDEGIPLYKQFYLPNLRNLSTESVSFSGISSNGLPTISGWHSLLTGEYPHSRSINMVSSVFNEVDDFPSWFRFQNYSSIYVSPSNPVYDGKQNWLFRGYPTIHKNNSIKRQQYKEMESFPKWFDEVYNLYPNQEQQKVLNIQLKQQKVWIPDRVTAAEFVHFYDNLAKQNKPVLGVWATVDTHLPFKGMDSLSEYEEFIVGRGFNTNEQKDQLTERYETVLKYTDHYIGKVVQYIKQSNRSTLLLVVGDHGARAVPIVRSGRVDVRDNESAQFDPSCSRKPFSNDQLFDTTGMIAYFGDDKYLKNKFELLKNKVIKVPTDHQDLIYTIYNIISNCTQVFTPTSRNGRDLLEIASNISNNLSLSSHVSLRSTSIHSEVAYNNQLFRFHSMNNKGEVFDQTYPTCILRNDSNTERQKLDKEQFSQFKQLQKLFDFLEQEDRVFSYQFRNQQCQFSIKCQFPLLKVKQSYRNEAVLYSSIFIFSGVGVGLGVFAFIKLVQLLVNKKCKKCNKRR